LSLFKAQLRKNKILLKTDLPENLPLVNVRPRAFRFVVLNLITNARFAVNEKEKTTDDSDYEKQITARLSYTPPSNVIVFEMEDNGIGMDTSTRDRCLEPFFTTRDVNEGIGMGLFIIYRISKELGIKIKIESEKDKGSLFRFLIPIAKGAI